MRLKLLLLFMFIFGVEYYYNPEKAMNDLKMLVMLVPLAVIVLLIFVSFVAWLGKKEIDNNIKNKKYMPRKDWRGVSPSLSLKFRYLKYFYEYKKTLLLIS